MNEIVRRLVSKVVEKFAGSGVDIDRAGRLRLPDGLDAQRMHRFIELCLDETFDHPRAALNALLGRVGIAPSVLAVHDQIVGEQGDVDFQAIARHSFAVSRVLPRFLEIPGRIRGFLIRDLGLADPGCASLEDAVVSTRERAAEKIGCEPSWNAILARPVEVAALAGPWRERVRP